MDPVIVAAITSSSILGGIQLLKFVHGKFNKNGQNGNGVCKHHTLLVKELAEVKTNVSWLKNYHEESGLHNKLDSLIAKVSESQN